MKVKCDIKKGDRVEVNTGKNLKKVGQVLRLVADKNRLRVLVQGVNMVTRHTKANAANSGQSGLVKKENPVHISSVNLICPKCTEATRVGHKFIPGVTAGKTRKVRVCKKCHEQIDD